MSEHEIRPTPAFPEYVIVEASNNCNLRCSMCDREKLDRPKGNIQMDIYKKIVNEVTTYPETKLALQFLGEPFLNPQIISMIKYAKQSGVSYVSITTNGTLLGRNKLIEDILNSGIDEINFSVDGATKKIYEGIRRGAKFEEVEANIHKILEKRANKIPKIKLIFCQTIENKGEEMQFIQKWEGIVDNITFKTGLDSEGKVIRQDLIDPNRPRTPCMEPWDLIVVYNNGDIGICCEDLNGTVLRANVKDSSLRDIWTNGEYEKIRNNQVSGDFSFPKICYDCEYWRRTVINGYKDEIYNNLP